MSLLLYSTLPCSLIFLRFPSPFLILNHHPSPLIPTSRSSPSRRVPSTCDNIFAGNPSPHGILDDVLESHLYVMFEKYITLAQTAAATLFDLVLIFCQSYFLDKFFFFFSLVVLSSFSPSFLLFLYSICILLGLVAMSAVG